MHSRKTSAPLLQLVGMKRQGSRWPAGRPADVSNRQPSPPQATDLHPCVFISYGKTQHGPHRTVRGVAGGALAREETGLGTGWETNEWLTASRSRDHLGSHGGALSHAELRHVPLPHPTGAIKLGREDAREPIERTRPAIRQENLVSCCREFSLPPTEFKSTLPRSCSFHRRRLSSSCESNAAKK